MSDIKGESPFRKDCVKGVTVLLTGGGSGITFGIARVFAAHGLMGRREKVLEDACKALQNEFGAKVAYSSGDVRKPSDCERAVQCTLDSFQRCDWLVNGAAGNFVCPMEKLSTNGFRSVVEIDLLGSFNMAKACLPAFKANGGGIINITATLGYTQSPLVGHASAAKVAIDSLTRTLAVEWAKYGVRVVSIAPGPIADTEGYKRLSQGMDMGRLIPLGRAGTKDEIGYTALFLITKAAGYITGETLIVDGGHWLNRAENLIVSGDIDMKPGKL